MTIMAADTLHRRSASRLAEQLMLGELDEETAQHITQGLREMREAYPAYAQAEAYYNGNVSEVFSHNNIARLLGATKNRYRLNFAKTPVNVVADRLNIGSVIVTNKATKDSTEDDPNTSADDDPDAELTRTFEQDVWKAAKMGRKSGTIHLRVSMYGDAYLFVWPQTPTKEDPSQIYVQYNSPKTTRVIYDPDDTERILFTIKMWWENKRIRVTLYYADRVERFISKKQNEEVKTASEYETGRTKALQAEKELMKLDNLSGKDFEPYVPNAPADNETIASPLGIDSHIIENPLGRQPIIHFRNDFPYGRPEHVDAYGPQDALNKTSTTLMHSVEYQGFPQRYGLAQPNAELGGDTNAGAGSWEDEEDSVDTDSDDRAVDSGPGTIAVLKGMASVGQFMAADSANFLGAADFFIRAMAQVTDTPLRFFFPPTSHAPSGESVRAEDAPLNQKLGKRERTYDDPWAEFSALGMEIVTEQESDTFDVTIRWQPRASIEDAMGWQTVQLKINTGVPIRQALIEAGYSADQVDGWLKDNLDRFEIKRDIGMLAELTTAAQALTAVGQAGGMPPIVLRQLLYPLFERLTGKKMPEPTDEPLKEIAASAPPAQLPRPFNDNDGLPQPPVAS